MLAPSSFGNTAVESEADTDGKKKKKKTTSFPRRVAFSRETSSDHLRLTCKEAELGDIRPALRH